MICLGESKSRLNVLEQGALQLMLQVFPVETLMAALGGCPLGQIVSEQQLAHMHRMFRSVEWLGG